MKQDFLELISMLLGEQPGRLIAENEQSFHSLSERFNDVLQVTNEQEKLHTEMMYKGERYLIPPVPFASTNERNQPIAFAFLGLNPKLFLDNDTTIQEKNYAGETWDEYANFYTTINRNEHDIGSFYRNLTVIMESLKNKKLVKWSEFAKGCQDKHERLERFNSVVEKDPLLVGELIPFHSSKIGAIDKQTLHRLFREVDEYERYLTSLFTTIFHKLDANGWMIANGKGASAALEMFIENNLLQGSFHQVLDKKTEKYTCYVWEHEGAQRKILLLHQFLFTKGGALNGYEPIENMLMNVLDAFEQGEVKQ